MADPVTTEKSPDEIEREMLQTRESLTEKVAALENQVVGTVQTVAETINGTVETVKSLVSTAPEAVSDTVKQATAAVSDVVKDTFNITGHIRRHPWAALGISVLAGCVTGLMIFRRHTGSARVQTLAEGMAETYPAAAAAESESKPGLFDDLLNMAGSKLKEVVRSGLEVATASVKENIQTGISQLMQGAVQEFTHPSHQRAAGAGETDQTPGEARFRV